jgi:hypothetical protein
MESNSIGLEVHELVDQDISMANCLLMILVQWGMLQMRVLLIRREEEL